MEKKLSIEQFSPAEQQLWHSIRSRIIKERVFGNPIKNLYLKPEIYRIYKGIVSRCEDHYKAKVGYVFDGVHIKKGLATQFEPFTVDEMWAKTEDERQLQREELGMQTLN